MLESSPTPSAAQIDALPNICPCGAYPRIRKAILRAAQAMGGAVPITSIAQEADPAMKPPAPRGQPKPAGPVVTPANRFSGG
jgi:isoquinoline 1-oxidoreductase alpha subunit